MKKNLFLAFVLFLLIALVSYFYVGTKKEISSEQDTSVVYKDVIKLTNPLPGDVISSPLHVTGEARGNWYFEATFPVVLTNWDGLIIAEWYATARIDPEDEAGWMTTEFVPFESTLKFEVPEKIEGVNHWGSLILRKDNPSGLPEHDDAFEIQVRFTP